MLMAEREVIVSCYLNGSIKYGPDGVCYEGSSLKKIGVKRKTKLNRLLDGLYLIFGLDKQRSKFEIFGRYPVVVLSPNQFRYAHFPVVDDSSLENMLEVPSNHPSINNVELYLEVKPISDPGSSSKRQRIQQPQEDTDLRHQPVKLEKEANSDFGNGSTHCDSSSGVLKPCVSSLWLDDHELRVGLCFKDSDDLKKAVSWFSFKGQQKCLVRETVKDECMFECVRWKCKWSLEAAKMEKHGLFEITKYTGPHTCLPTGQEDLKSEFEADEIERVVRVQPTLTIAELESWWFEKFGYKLETWKMEKGKQQVIKRIYGDWDESFRVLAKLMAAFQSSNGVVVDWQYDLFPNPEFASFRGVFWAFPQSIEGFRHCRPLIFVDTKDLNGKYPMKLMIASGRDADDCFFPLAFAVTTELSVDSWRWFLTGIRDKITQREGICLISSGHPDILAVINEPESRWQEPWAYHRFSLEHFCSQFHNVFQDDYLKRLVKDAGSTHVKDKFNSCMKTIKKKNLKARQWLDKFPPHQWALAHDNGHRRYGNMITDLENVFSSFQSIDFFSLPVTAIALLLFDNLRLDFQHGICDSRSRLTCGDMYTELVMKKLQEFRTGAITYLVTPVDNNVFQVTTPLDKDGWMAQLSERTCTCGEFQDVKFPCLHALAVCEKLKINPLQYVEDGYSLERLYKTYAATFNAVPQVSAWPEVSGVPILFPPTLIIPTPAPKIAGKSELNATPKTVKRRRAER